MPETIDPRMVAFERGRQMFRDGVFITRNIWSDEEWRGPLNEGQCEWLGWMMGRAAKLSAEFRARDRREEWDRWANGDGPLPREEVASAR